MPLRPGERLGPYEILMPIGAGGMGDVYRASDSRLKRDVAIKVSREQFSERFEREARAAAALNHPNICHLYDIGPDYLVMELIEGETLRGPLPAAEVIKIAGQIAAALDAAHEKGIVHRDLKPDNIKITPDGVVKVLDFGLAKVSDPISGSAGASLQNSPTIVSGATQEGIILGTAAYMSPEQARGNPVDKRTDIWAFGVIVYELLTGEPAHKGDTLSDTLASVIRDEPDFNKVPDPFRVLLRRCLEKDPKRRLRDIGDAVALIGTGTESAVSGIAPRRASIAWLLAGICAVAAAGISIVHFREKLPASPPVSRFQIRLPENVRFTSSGGIVISPDGRHVAFSASTPDGRPAVWIQDLDAVEAHALPGTYTGSQPPPFFWSPDSRYVVYSENSPKLKKADLQTGALQDICDKPGPPVGGSWSKDGTIIFGSNSTGLWKVPSAGGKPVPLTMLDPARREHEHELPWFLPDGHHFIYLRLSDSEGESGIFAGSIDDPPERQSKKEILPNAFGASFIPSNDGGPGWLVFVRDNNVMAQRFDPGKLELSGEPVLLVEGIGSVFQTGYASVADTVLVYRTSGSIRDYVFKWFDRQGRPGQTAGEPASINTPRFSRDGALVAYRKDSFNTAASDLWLLDLKRDASTRFTFGPQQASYPVFSPDGTEVVFAVQVDGVWQLYRKPTNGSKEPQLLLKTGDHKKPLSWSADGRFLIYGTSKSIVFGTVDMWILPMQGDPKPQPFLTTPFDEDQAEFSPDGRWVAYQSNESGRYEVYVREFISQPGGAGAGGKWMVSKDGGRAAHWSKDGKELVYVGFQNDVMSVPVEPGSAFRAGPPRELFKVPGGAFAYAVPSDLSRFLFIVSVDAKGPQAFSVMLNWPSLLKGR